MKSSTGHHFVALDHVRGLAAFTVVAWHFTHGLTGYPVPFGTAPELGFLDEGHVGVALFMTLSGYLFTKLLDGKDIKVSAFLWNRFLRLMPLLALVLGLGAVVNHVTGGSSAGYFYDLIRGAILPTLPYGGWSITVEAHFYLVLPFLLLFVRKWSLSLLLFTAVAIAYRYALYVQAGEIQHLAFSTIIGRIDQFMLGMLAFHHRDRISGRIAAAVAVLFLGAYSLFDLSGGYYHLPDAAGAVWTVLPAFEGACLATLIAWYDRNPLRSGPVSWAMQKAGEYSYSIYLLHFFFYAAAARFVHTHVMDISNFYGALAWAALFFALMACLGHYSFKYIEKPFLAFRRPYVVEPAPAGAAVLAASASGR